MKNIRPPKIAIIDNAVEPDVYRPVVHWTRYLPAGSDWTAFRAPERILPDLGGKFTHVILTGSEASILEPDPWAEEEADFVREADRRGLALLGSCYGHQLLAWALAGSRCVGSCGEPEIGWIPVIAETDSAVFGARGAESYVFSLHFDEVRELPPSFAVLASTRICPVQAFALEGRPVRGYQIHPEIDPSEARFLLRAQAERCGRGGGSLYRRALDLEPRDSGLIHRIVAEFLSAALDKPASR